MHHVIGPLAKGVPSPTLHHETIEASYSNLIIIRSLDNNLKIFKVKLPQF